MRRLPTALPKLLAAGLLASLLAGCETLSPSTPPPPPRPIPPPRVQPPSGPPPFRASDFAWSAAKGGGQIIGQVNYRARSGERWSCSGQTVGLTPEAPHSTDRITKLYGSNDHAIQSVAAVLARSATAGKAEYGQFLRDTACEANDTFNFKDLPDGGYYLIVRVHPPAGAGQDDLVIMQKVAIRGGSIVRLVLPPGAPPAAATPPPRPAPTAPRKRTR